MAGARQRWSGPDFVLRWFFWLGACGFLVLSLLGCVTSEPTPQAITPAAEQVPLAQPSSPEERVDMPQWRVGDTWVWSDGYGLRVESVDGGTALFRRLDDPEQWVKREGLFMVESQSTDALRKVVFRTRDPREIFPLKVGGESVFRREYLANGELRVHRTSWVVEGREQIRVPAGEFDCWILIRRTRSLSSDWVGYERGWYSPLVKGYVRLEYKYGKSKPGSRVLMEYTLAP